MSKIAYLSDEFFAQVEERGRELPHRGQPTLTAQYVVNQLPEGQDEVHYFLEFDQGQIKRARRGDAEDAAFVITISYANSVKLQTGKLSPPVAFTTGKMRAKGNMGKLMGMIPLVQSKEYQALFAELREITEF